MKKLIIGIGCVYLFIPIAISLSMQLNIFSLALGDANGWLGFWGGYSGSLVGALAAGLIAIYVSRTQIHKQAQLDDLRERELIIIKLRIEKYQEVFNQLSELNRSYVKWNMVITRYRRDEISIEELIAKDIEEQETIIGLRRLINSYVPFLEGLNSFLSTLIDKELAIGNLIYDYFTNKGEGEIYTIYENPNQSLKEQFHDLMIYNIDEIERINQLIQNELNKLITR